MDASAAKSPENMTSTELKAHLAAGTVAGTTPSKTGKVKAKRPAKSKAKPAAKSKTSKATQRKGLKRLAKAATKFKASKAAKSSKPAKVPVVRQIVTFLVENKGTAFKSTDLAKRFKSRPVEIHRAVAILEREGASVEAARSGPTQKPGRRAFLYKVTKGPAPKVSKAKSKS